MDFNASGKFLVRQSMRAFRAATRVLRVLCKCESNISLPEIVLHCSQMMDAVHDCEEVAFRGSSTVSRMAD